uniref:mucin-5AC-like n=1 Tax=Ictidomys tridecemlineatus TaxID=43179 RepID=UPI001A9CF05D|nr:mucin-5AC-like [Ictidomys tridecemlineatus]
MSAFGAWCSSSQRGESPSNRQQHGARLERKTSSAPSQSTTMAPRKNTKEVKRGQENSRISTLSAIPQSLLTQKHQNSPQETGTTKGISSFSLVSMTSRGSGSQDLLPELITAFGDLCISFQRGGTPSNRQQHGAQLIQNTSSAPSHSTTVALGKHTEKGTKGQGNTHVLTLNAIPQSLPTQKHLSSPCRTSSTASKDTSSYPLVPVTSRGSRSHDMLPELIIAFEALCISSKRGDTPSNWEQHGAQLEQNTSSAPSQSTTGQKARHTPGKANSGVATVTAISQSLPTQKGLSSPEGTSTTSSKSTSTLMSTHNPSMSPGSPDWLPDLISAFGAMVISPRGETRSARKR